MVDSDKSSRLLLLIRLGDVLKNLIDLSVRFGIYDDGGSHLAHRLRRRRIPNLVGVERRNHLDPLALLQLLTRGRLLHVAAVVRVVIFLLEIRQDPPDARSLHLQPLNHLTFLRQLELALLVFVLVG